MCGGGITQVNTRDGGGAAAIGGGLKSVIELPESGSGAAEPIVPLARSAARFCGEYLLRYAAFL